MKKLILGILLILGTVSCSNVVVYEGMKFSNYELYVNYSINTLKSPVILIGIDVYETKNPNDTTLYYSILVKDANNIIKYYNYNSDIVNTIGATYKLGEKIR